MPILRFYVWVRFLRRRWGACGMLLVLGCWLPVAPCAAQTSSSDQGAPSAPSDSTSPYAAASLSDTPSRAALWRQKRTEKAETMESPTPGTLDRVVSFVRQTGSTILSDQILLDVPEVPVPGIRPAFGGLGESSGLAVGLHLEPPSMEGPGRYVYAQALASIRRYAGVEAIYGTENGPNVRYAYARFHHRPGEFFYGIGDDSTPDRKSTFRMNETLMGGLAGRSLTETILLGSHLSYRMDRYGPGRAGDVPTVNESFAPDAVDGLETDVDYLMMGTFFEYDTRNVPYTRAYGRRFSPTERRLRTISLDATEGLYVAAEVTHHLDVGSNRHSFTRFTVDAQQYIPLKDGAQHGLAFRQFASLTHTSPDQRVPFYRLQSLGGSRSLRGYADGRFRDRNVAMATAELRCQVWHWLDMAWFVDAGHVFRTLEEPSIHTLRYDVGLGFRLRTDEGTAARLEVARSAEGIRTILKLGSLL